MFFKTLTNNLLAHAERLFLFIPVLFGSGIGFYFSLTEEPAWLFVTIPLIMSALAAYLCHRQAEIYLISLACLIFVLGISCAKLETQLKSFKIEHFQPNTISYLKGVIQQTDLSAKLKTRLWLKDATDFDKPLKGLYRLTTNDKQIYPIGTCVETAAVLSSPSHPLKPGGFQFDRHAFFEGISAVGYTLTPFYKIDCAESGFLDTDFLSGLASMRQNITSAVQNTLPKNEAAIASAVLTGNKSFITKSLYKQYRTAGLAHFLAISGLHIGLIAALFFVLARLLFSAVPYIALKFSSHKAAAVCAVLFAFFYLLLSGASISAKRAFIMVCLAFSGIIFDRNAISLRTLAIAALIILIFQPHALLLAGFQMSFAAATALVAFYEFYQAKPLFQNHTRITKIGLYFLSVFLSSLVATLATLPYVIYHFTNFAPYAVLTNLIAAPLVAFIIMPLILIGLLLYPFGLLAYPLLGAGKGLAALNHLTAFVSSLPFADLSIPPMPTAGLILITFGGLWLCLWSQKERFFGLIFIIAGLSSYAFMKTPNILYTFNPPTVGIALKQKNELIIFSKKKNDFTAEILGQGFQKTSRLKNLQSIQDAGLICTKERCTYQNIVSFDLNGNLSLNHKPVCLKPDLGCAIYLPKNKNRVQTIRDYIGNRPWNNKKSDV